MTRTERKQKTIQNHTDRPTKQPQTIEQATTQLENWQNLIDTTFTLVEIRNQRNPNQVRFNIS